MLGGEVGAVQVSAVGKLFAGYPVVIGVEPVRGSVGSRSRTAWSCSYVLKSAQLRSACASERPARTPKTSIMIFSVIKALECSGTLERLVRDDHIGEDPGKDPSADRSTPRREFLRIVSRVAGSRPFRF